MASAVSRAKDRLGVQPSDEVLEYAKRLTAHKMLVKGLPPSYGPLLLEDVIIETYMMAAINFAGERNRREKDHVQHLQAVPV